ncbi:GAF domain-containing sensor histidine kinase [uncultured Sulfitobacter sp.]|uniref:GAF domain-containing sensor histidine kinase n=1 Tax=uncultured Sulfitobacter sp. TaxID=191468 RepID=UPI00260E1258|nr:GAF domain-containing sensor histidine kinase [uncultured Sulfitobacter sp.]
MRSFPVPFNEEARLKSTREMPGLSGQNDEVFRRISNAAKSLLGCPCAQISIVEEAHLLYRDGTGDFLAEMVRAETLCTHTIMSDSPLIFPDLQQEVQFQGHPMVQAGGFGLRFYIGIPLMLSSGFKVGSLCVFDTEPHPHPSEGMIGAMIELGAAIIATLEQVPAQRVVTPPAEAASNFLTLVGHELRTPLTVMKGALSLMEGRLNDPVNLRLAQSATRSTEHLAKLIDTILRFSDAETGDLHLNAQPVTLCALMEEMHLAHSPGVDASGKRFDPPHCAVGRAVLMDPDHMRICITSLLLNSILHGGDEMRLWSEFDADGNVLVSVHDTGTLEAHVELAELYKPFVVGGSLDTRGAHGGLGLGLPLTRKLVELHSGAFEVLADAQGTTARIRLPKWRLEAVN